MAEGKRKLQMSFGGCGFLGVYHIGVGKCVMDHAPHLFGEFEAFYGASSGAITAIFAACNMDAMVAYKWVKKTFEASRKYRVLGTLHPSFDLYTRVRTFLEDNLPPNAHRLARGKVHISLTLFPSLKNWIVSNFATRKELINAIIASSFIPVYAGLKDLPLFRGKRCFDGGFSSNIPCVCSTDVISVSPFSGGCDICPQGESHSPHVLHIVDQPIQISGKNFSRLAKALIPSSWADLEELFTTGYKDALRFFTTEGFFVRPPVRPLRRISSQLPLATESEVAETMSEYYSVSGESSLPANRSRSQSLACEFLSCLEEEEEESAFSADHLQLLEEELRRLEEEEEEERAREEENSGSSLAQQSWSKVSWLLHSCTPSHLPLVQRLGQLASFARSHTSSSHTPFDNSQSGRLTILDTILSSSMSVIV